MTSTDKMIKLLSGDTRDVHGYMNFKNRANPDPLTAYGPTVGEYPMDLYAVEISEDGKRVGYSFVAPGKE